MALRLLSKTGFKYTASPFVANYHDYVRCASPGGAMRIPLASPKVIGVANSRGNRGHQEDFYSFATLSLNPEELRISVKKAHGIDWDPSKVGDLYARQVIFVGIYDGHGGSAVSQYLRQELHGLFESVDKSMIPELYTWITKEVGGYFKRYRGGPMTPWIHGVESTSEMDLEARAALAFYEVDKNLSSDPVAQNCGATASLILLHTLDSPAAPFFSATKTALTVAHCGDTRVLLCSTNGGRVFTMTENHHADSRVESARLRKMMGSALITDSFGESRWMGALANTRSLGDLKYKRFGVTPEPEELGGEDNATAIVVPLAGWGHITGPDKTKDLREYRLQEAAGSERLRRM